MAGGEIECPEPYIALAAYLGSLLEVFVEIVAQDYLSIFLYDGIEIIGYDIGIGNLAEFVEIVVERSCFQSFCRGVRWQEVGKGDRFWIDRIALLDQAGISFEKIGPGFVAEEKSADVGITGESPESAWRGLRIPGYSHVEHHL